jgi:hypothetical protein
MVDPLKRERGRVAAGFINLDFPLIQRYYDV